MIHKKKSVTVHGQNPRQKEKEKSSKNRPKQRKYKIDDKTF
jgi:hypothetical protein